MYYSSVSAVFARNQSTGLVCTGHILIIINPLRPDTDLRCLTTNSHNDTGNVLKGCAPINEQTRIAVSFAARNVFKTRQSGTNLYFANL